MSQTKLNEQGLPAICSEECEGPVTYTEVEFRGVPYIWFACECSEGPYAPV